MSWCYRPDCPRAAKHRLEKLTQPRWRNWLRLPPKVWYACDEHLFDPISSGRYLTAWKRP